MLYAIAMGQIITPPAWHMGPQLEVTVSVCVGWVGLRLLQPINRVISKHRKFIKSIRSNVPKIGSPMWRVVRVAENRPCAYNLGLRSRGAYSPPRLKF